MKRGEGEEWSGSGKVRKRKKGRVMEKERE